MVQSIIAIAANIVFYPVIYYDTYCRYKYSGDSGDQSQCRKNHPDGQ